MYTFLMLENVRKYCHETFGRSLVLTGRPSASHHDFAILRHDSLYTQSGVLIENSTYCAGENVEGAFNYHVYAPRMIAPDVATEEGPSDCFWLGYFHDHFGHFLTSTLQRLWHLPAHKRHYAGYIAPHCGGRDDENGFIAGIFDSLKIERRAILQVPENTILRSIVIAEPAFVENSHCYRIWGSFMRDLGRSILGTRRKPPEKRPIFLSRSQTRSATRCYEGEETLSQLLSNFGIETCHPESLSLKEQLTLWDSHSVFIGFSGSAFMNAAFFDNKTIIILNHDGYIFGTQRMIDAIAHNKALYLEVDLFLAKECSVSHRYRITEPEALTAEIIRAVRCLA
ncbi:glycosyltransferase family 61 protein [Asaia sp. BMEF1]|uniref:glycosyltransferase family 61 protein n=1 Tax=Asaia sp. BMEF1 TaxID=3155932 RepID=UPI003F67F3DA